jgi:RHS repeat-associated protein
MLYNPEGYCQNTDYVILNYFRRDHLGNNREVWRAPFKVGRTNYAATTMQRTQYYPSGLPWASNSGDNPWVQNKKYNGKEFVEMHGYDSYAFGHRDFYAAINRFTTIDWKAEDTYDVSPYSYAGNNPVRYRDENGDGLRDVIVGAIDAFVDDAVPTSSLSGTAQPDNEAHYLIGQAIGHVAAGLVGGAEIITGGGAAAAGTTVAVVTAPTVVVATAGAGVAVAGTAVATHGAMMTANATKNMAGMKQKFENASNKQSNVSTGNKNSPHANKDAKQSATQKYNIAKTKYEELRSKPNKTPDDKKQLEKLKKEVNQQQMKKDFTGENHSRNAKGSRK